MSCWQDYIKPIRTAVMLEYPGEIKKAIDIGWLRVLTLSNYDEFADDLANKGWKAFYYEGRHEDNLSMKYRQYKTDPADCTPQIKRTCRTADLYDLCLSYKYLGMIVGDMTRAHLELAFQTAESQLRGAKKNVKLFKLLIETVPEGKTVRQEFENKRNRLIDVFRRAGIYPR